MLSSNVNSLFDITHSIHTSPGMAFDCWGCMVENLAKVADHDLPDSSWLGHRECCFVGAVDCIVVEEHHRVLGEGV